MKDMRNVLDVFEDYLAEDKNLELLWSKHGVTVGLWSEHAQEWEDFTTCADAKALCAELCKQYTAYKATMLSKRRGHDLSKAEMQPIRESCALACKECGYSPEEMGVLPDATESEDDGEADALTPGQPLLSVSSLAKLPGRVYVQLPSDQIGTLFLAAAEAEGFTFCDGAAPTSRHYETFMAVNHDKTLNYVGVNGRVAFQTIAETVNGEPLLRFIGTAAENGQIVFASA